MLGHSILARSRPEVFNLVLFLATFCKDLTTYSLTIPSPTIPSSGGSAAAEVDVLETPESVAAPQKDEGMEQDEKGRKGIFPQQPERLGVLPIKLRGGLGQPPETLHQVPRGSEGMEPVPK